MIELSTLSASEGNLTEALKVAQQAVALAQQRSLESLASGGLIELGNSFTDKGDYEDAEKYYLQAIDLAQTGKSKRREAIARSNLGGMYIQTQRIDQGLPLMGSHDFKSGVNFINEPRLYLTFNTGTGGYSYTHLDNNVNGPLSSVSKNGGLVSNKLSTPA